MGARCEGCGGQVMSYRRYMTYFKFSADCDACGAEVRLRGVGGVVVGSVLLGAAMMYAIFRSVAGGEPGVGNLTIPFLVIAIVAFALDIGSYHLLSWTPKSNVERGSPGD